MILKRLRRRIRELKAEMKVIDAGQDLTVYRERPVDYARDVLGVAWWSKQQEIVAKLQTPPYRVLVKAAHSVGKSHLAGSLVNWWFDTHVPGVALTTAPTSRQVKHILWKEIRYQRRGRGGFTGPRSVVLQDAPDHFALGYTARNAEGFQGQHSENVLILFDEAVGIDAEFWDAAKSMTMGVRHAWVAFCNPTLTTSRFYQEEQLGGWHVVHMPCIDHPNIAAELAGKPAPYPAAVRLEWLEERLREWTRPVVGDPRPTDLEWPPGSGVYVRPGPLAEARLLGRWPTIASGVWSDQLWAACEVEGDLPRGVFPEIGCDVARAGDDNTSFHVRLGPVSLHHEEVNGFKTNETAGRLKELARHYAKWWNKSMRERHAARLPAKDVLIKIDDAGVGGGVVDQADGYTFIGVNAATVALEPEKYPNKRSELWFNTAERAERGELCVGRLDAETRQKLRIQAMAPAYSLDAAGRRVVDPKEDTKEILGASPDGMDGMNLAYYEPGGLEGPTAVPVKRPKSQRAKPEPEARDERPRGQPDRPTRRRHWR